MAPILGTSALAIAAMMLAVWGVSLWRRDASIVDIFWGLGFVLVAVCSLRVAPAPGPRAYLVSGLTAIWGLRLALYLAWRNLGREEDYRYQAMRRAAGDRFAWVSLYQVFALQGVLMWIVSLPVQGAIGLSGGDGLGILDFVGALCWAVGLGFEAIGDWQLVRFKAEPANAGRVMNRGLWAWTRHPNYFGDFTVWWGLGCLGLAAGAWWSLVGSLVMSVLLIRVSGAALLEKGLTKRKPEYAAYIAATSPFFPRAPRGKSYDPLDAR